MTDAEKREAAHQFINRWMGRGNEDEDYNGSVVKTKI